MLHEEKEEGPQENTEHAWREHLSIRRILDLQWPCREMPGDHKTEICWKIGKDKVAETEHYWILSIYITTVRIWDFLIVMSKSIYSSVVRTVGTFLPLNPFIKMSFNDASKSQTSYLPCITENISCTKTYSKRALCFELSYFF